MSLRFESNCPPIRLLFFLSFTFIWLTGAAWSQCVPPSSPGVVICTPTNNSTIAAAPPELIAVQATPAQGASLTGLIIYDNYAQIYSGPPYTGINFSAGLYDGWQYVVANAWDSDGNLYQASTNFYVTGYKGAPPCQQPSKPSVVICSPQAGTVYPIEVEVSAAALGKSNITNLSFYLNGKLVDSINNTYGAGYEVQLPSQGTNYTVQVVAKDSDGDTYSVSKVLNADYTYESASCFHGVCTPGIQINLPEANAYVSNTFNVNAQILYNTNAITEMKAYLDDSVVAQSSNATLHAEVSDAPDGTHILTIQGWDDKGIEYRLQENININVNK